MMKGIFTVLMLLFLSLTAKAYDNYGLWCNGRLTLDNGEVIEGEINYDLKFEVIRIRDNGITRAFTAKGVLYFTMFDPIKFRQRDFVSLDHRLESGYERKAFFEIIADGHIAVLRKSEYIRRPRITEDYRAPHIYLNAVCKHHYYVLRGGDLIAVDNFETQVLPLMSQFEEEINRYITTSRLKLKEIQAQMRVVHLYNQLYDNNKFKNTQADLYFRGN